MKKIVTRMLVCALVFSLLGFGWNTTEAKEIKVGKPKISLKTSDDTITVTIKKTENAEDYSIFIKGSKDDRYYIIASIEAKKNGKTKFTIENLTDDEYSIRVLAYNGLTPSKYSSVKKITVETEKEIHYEKVFPSWNAESSSLKELVDFVKDTTEITSEGYLDPADRIAVFDMDGTILCEKAPVYVDYCLTMYRVLDDPDFDATPEETEAIQQVRDHAYTEGKTYKPKGITKHDMVASAFAGMTPEEFRKYVVDFADNTKVVGFSGMTYGQSFYKPMIEVINFLRDNDFDVWMVSACEREVVRALVERYGIPYDHVVATDVPYVASGKGDKKADNYNMGQDEDIVLGAPLNEVKCGKSEKSASIAREIGKRPILAFGNSSGDYSMLNYAEGNPYHTGMGFFIVCDDTVREYGNDEKAADFYKKVKDEDWTAISMANDWKTIYGDDVVKTGLPDAA